jgi:phage tail protein X
VSASGQVLIAADGEALDGLLWRVAGLTPDVLPAVLDANPGLAALTVLPAGTPVRLPVLPAASPRREVIQLWS